MWQFIKVEDQEELPDVLESEILVSCTHDHKGVFYNNTRKLPVPRSRNMIEISGLYPSSHMTFDEGYRPEPSVIYQTPWYWIVKLRGTG